MEKNVDKKTITEITKEVMTGLFDSIISGAEKEAEMEPLYDHFRKNEKWFKDPEEFHLFVMFKIEQIVGMMVRKVVGTDDWIIKGIYQYWNFFDGHVTKLCDKFDGMGCCADKGRFVVKSFIKYRKTKELPVWGKDEKAYWEPKHGTPKQWMDFVEALGGLRYGSPDKYMIALRDLMEACKTKEK